MNNKEPKRIPLSNGPRSKEVKKIPLTTKDESIKDDIIRPDNDSIYRPIKNAKDR